ncbi:MAG: PilZ domain-containing protein [Bdellovibrionaceae bacterium]|nr:PilZ domain-containing protein [Pseudobdellovibrionaceae bacterium]
MNLISKWNIQSVPNEDTLKGLLGMPTDKARHFLMELSEINEKKYVELKSMGERYGKKIKFIVFYQTLKPSPLINKLHGSEVLLIGPQERNITNILLKRFFQNPEPLFRRWERFQVLTTGTLSLLSGEGSAVNVNVSHFSAHGARIEMSQESFKKKDFVILDYVSHDGKKIRMQSRVTWTQGRDKTWVGGLQFISGIFHRSQKESDFQ